MTTTVYVWHKGIRLGHCSLNVSNGEDSIYISFWPKTNEWNWENVTGNFARMPDSYEEDCSDAYCFRPADSCVVLNLPYESIDNLRTKKFFYQLNNYSLIEKNCCSVVSECLTMLSGLEIVALTPLDILNKALELQHKFGKPPNIRTY
jgi:hypothetical protein